MSSSLSLSGHASWLAMVLVGLIHGIELGTASLMPVDRSLGFETG